jgi:hypothetical protein
MIIKTRFDLSDTAYMLDDRQQIQKVVVLEIQIQSANPEPWIGYVAQNQSNQQIDYYVEEQLFKSPRELAKHFDVIATAMETKPAI